MKFARKVALITGGNSGIDHPGSWARADLVIPIVREFLYRQN